MNDSSVHASRTCIARSSRSVLLGVASLVAALSLTFSGGLLSRADESVPQPKTAAEARSVVEKIAQEQRQFEEELLGSQEKTDKLSAQIGEKEKQVEIQRAKVNQSRKQISTYVLAQYQSSQDLTEQFALSKDPNEFINRAGRVDYMAQKRNSELRNFQAEQAALQEAQRMLTSQKAQLKATLEDSARLRSDIQTRAAKAKAVYAQLNTEEQKRFDSDEKAKVDAAQKSSQDAQKQLPNVPASGQAKSAVDFAMAQIGKAYVFGATGPSAYDCSGLTMASWRAAGVSIPRTAGGQLGAGHRVSLQEALPGDLVIYHSGGHVEMYIGNGKTVGAVNPKVGIVIRGVNDESGLTAIVRVLG